MSATAAPDEATIRVYGKRTDAGGYLVCVADKAAGLEMCWPPLNTVQIAAAMAASAHDLLSRQMHDANRGQSDDVVVPPKLALWTPR